MEKWHKRWKREKNLKDKIEKYDGEWKNDKYEGKGIYYYKNGDRYEGDWKNGKREGKGIYYYSYGDRKMGDYLDGEEKGKHVTLTFDGKIETNDDDNNNDNFA